jgi:hypothetical protein
LDTAWLDVSPVVDQAYLSGGTIGVLGMSVLFGDLAVIPGIRKDQTPDRARLLCRYNSASHNQFHFS